LEKANVEKSNMLWKRKNEKLVDFLERENIKMQMAEEGQKIRYEITTGLWARPSSYLKDYFTGVTRDNGTVGVAFLTRHVDLLVEYLAVSGFFLCVLEFFHFGPTETLTWLHCSVPFGLNVNVSSFPLIFVHKIPTVTSIVVPAVLKNGLPRMRGI
jgi:hypothetical protein